MTKEDALIIKEWRVAGCTWRRVAEKAADLWPDREYISGNQIEGRELCLEACNLLDEDWYGEIWN